MVETRAALSFTGCDVRDIKFFEKKATNEPHVRMRVLSYEVSASSFRMLVYCGDESYELTQVGAVIHVAFCSSNKLSS